MPQDKELRRLSLHDCIYLSENCSCDILTVSACIGESCTFRQDEKILTNQNEQWAAKMRGLSESKQKKIASKYYKNKMPWKE
ncbi:MAG: hypothetical protein LBT30_04470 [Clostridiales bacterium]|nr:hypothetical protein [Clostridiales bacterium]